MPENKEIDSSQMEQRSAAKALYDAAMATGAVTGGVGTLGLGAAAVKKAFGGSNDVQSQAPTQQQDPQK